MQGIKGVNTSIYGRFWKPGSWCQSWESALRRVGAWEIQLVRV